MLVIKINKKLRTTTTTGILTHEIGNIEKCPFTYWLKWEVVFQIVDIHVGNFNVKLTGRWFPQIVDRGQWESISNIYKTKIVVLASELVGGRSRATELPYFD